MKPSFIFLFLVLVLGLFPLRAVALIESIPLNYVFSPTDGSVRPANTTSPWLVLHLEDGFGPNTVRLTLDASGLSNVEFASNWYVNLNPALNATQLSFSIVSNPTALSLGDIRTGTNAFKADGDGHYDILFDFPPPPGSFPAKLTAGEKVVVDVTRIGGLSLSDFHYQSVESTGNGVYYTAAHIQGIGADSAWIGATELSPPAPIPEPSAYVAFMGGVVLFFAHLRRRIGLSRCA